MVVVVCCCECILTFGVCLNPRSQWEDDHQYFTKGSGSYPSLFTVKAFGRDVRNDSCKCFKLFLAAMMFSAS